MIGQVLSALVVFVLLVNPVGAQENVNDSNGRLPADTNYLYRSPDRYANPRVGILKIRDGKAELNPRAPYPESANLSELDLNDAEKLWGSSKKNTDSGDYVVFALWGILALDKQKKNLYYIDAKFPNGKMISYRVRGAGISSADWVKVP
ncbi:hypothetical protein BH10CYA1_BH10CYA1_43380 [soil metagenome]